ncbi:MAG: preprotein translocase subunit YajC [Bdellovibrionales bacterium]
MFTSMAWAQAAGPAAGPSLIEQLFPFLFIILIFFFLVWRPQQRRAQEQKKFREGLKRGDSVLTSGGILGTIEGLTDSVVTLQIANGVKIKVLRSAISASTNEELEKK